MAAPAAAVTPAGRDVVEATTVETLAADFSGSTAATPANAVPRPYYMTPGDICVGAAWGPQSYGIGMGKACAGATKAALGRATDTPARMCPIPAEP